MLSVADDPNFIIDVSCNPLMVTEPEGYQTVKSSRLLPTAPLTLNETCLLEPYNFEVTNEENPDLMVTFEFGEDGVMHDLLQREEEQETHLLPAPRARITPKKRVINDELTKLSRSDMQWDSYVDNMAHETRVKRARLAKKLSMTIANEFIGGNMNIFERYIAKQGEPPSPAPPQRQQPEDEIGIEVGRDATPEMARNVVGGVNNSSIMPWSASAGDNSRLQIVRGASRAGTPLIGGGGGGGSSRRLSYLDTPLARRQQQQQQLSSSDFNDEELLYMDIDQPQHSAPLLDSDTRDFYYFLQGRSGEYIELNQLVEMSPKESQRIVAVCGFRYILQLATKNLVNVNQVNAWGPIDIQALPS